MFNVKYNYKRDQPYKKYGFSGLFGPIDYKSKIPSEKKSVSKKKGTMEQFNNLYGKTSTESQNINTKQPNIMRMNAEYSLPNSYSKESPPRLGVNQTSYQSPGTGINTKSPMDDRFQPPSLNIALNNMEYYPFLFTNDHRQDYFTRSKEATYGKEVTQLSALFFSKKNIDLIQKLIKNAIRLKSKNKIILTELQDENDLMVIMMAAYHEYGRDLPGNIDKQIFELNSITVQSILPGILTNLKQYMFYVRDIALPRIVLDLPLNVSSKGRRGTPSITTIF